MAEKKKTDLPFIRAYNFLLERKDLKPAEKLVLIVLCRFWPSPFWGSNSTIAKNLGISARWVQKLIKNLKSKKVIRCGYAHKGRDAKLKTVRLIIPLCLPGKCVLQDVDINSVQTDVSITSDCSQTSVQSDTLIERNRKRIERE